MSPDNGKAVTTQSVQGLQVDVVSDPINQTQRTLENFWAINGLPTKGKLYPEGTVIKGRPLKTMEVKKLATLNEDNIESIVNEILDSAITGIEVRDILVADKMYLLFWLRANTYKESGFNIEFYCGQCDSESEYEFDIDNIVTTDIRDNYDANRVLELPSSKKTVKVKYLKISDEKKVANFLVNNHSMMTYDEEMLNIANFISNINGNDTDSLLDAYTFVVSLDPADFAYIVSYLNHIECGIKNEMVVTCKKCGGQSPTGVTFRPSFFVPVYKFD